METDKPKNFLHSFPDLAAANLPANHKRFTNDRAYTHAWIQGRPWVLKHGLYLGPAFTQRRAAQPMDWLASQPDLTTRGRLVIQHQP